MQLTPLKKLVLENYWVEKSPTHYTLYYKHTNGKTYSHSWDKKSMEFWKDKGDLQKQNLIVDIFIKNIEIDILSDQNMREFDKYKNRKK